MREWLREEIDSRPVIGTCSVCGCDIHGSGPGYYADDYFEFFSERICEECVMVYVNRNFRKGGD